MGGQTLQLLTVEEIKTLGLNQFVRFGGRKSC
jgi:hypothetical protein